VDEECVGVLECWSVGTGVGVDVEGDVSSGDRKLEVSVSY
jgi:hypothetical protein